MKYMGKGMNNSIKKGVVVAVILLFVSVSVIPSTGTRIVSKSNMVTYSENSTICGFLTDFETGEPIFLANIEFHTEDYQGNDYEYFTESDENGFYIVEKVVAGYCVDNGAYANGYHFYWGEWFEIPENETVWVNMSMYPLQPETSKVCGYVYDNHTGEPIFNISVILHWFDIWSHINYNGTKTDENGFYSMNLGAGRCYVYIDDEAYIPNGSVTYYIDDYETVWINISLEPELIVEIIKPDNRFYFKNKMIFPFCFPIIIGPIDIEINVTLNAGNPIEQVEVLIDGISKHNFTTVPYIYYWDEKTPLRFRHKLEIIAHRNWDSDGAKEIEVWKFF